METSAPTGGAMDDLLGALGAALDTDRRWLAGALGAAMALHLTLAVTLPCRGPAPRVAPSHAIEIEVDVEQPPPPPNEPPPPPVAPPSTELPRPASPRHAAAPPLAQAAKVLARDSHADDPADLTGDFVTGSGSAYVGGTTSATGTSQHLVREATAAGPPARGDANGRAADATGPDRSRPARMAGSSTWQCPFPVEADDVNEATVPMRVALDATGRVVRASVLRDPGHGFGREATRCVLAKTWVAALGRDGVAVAATVTVVVHFMR